MSDKHDENTELSAGAASQAGSTGQSHSSSHHSGAAAHGGGGHEESEGAPEWLISFADNVMLQMGFFVILLAMSLKAPGGGAEGEGGGKGSKNESTAGGPTAEQLDFALAMRDAFNNPVDMGSTDPHDWLLVRRLRLRAVGQSDAVQEGLEGREHDVQSIRQTKAYGAGGLLLFDTDASELTESARADVAELARHFRGCQTVLDVRGHCSAAEAFDREDHGVPLSYERAWAVARELATQGIEWNRLRVTACADNERVTPTAYSEAGHRSNQRVEVVETERGATPSPESPDLQP